LGLGYQFGIMTALRRSSVTKLGVCLYFLLASPLIVGSAARADNWPQAAWISNVNSLNDLQVASSVSLKDFRSDLDSLEHMFQTAYGGWSVNGPAIQAAMAQLRTVSDTQFTGRQVCQMIGAKFDQIPDGHLFMTGYPFDFECGNSRHGRVGNNLTTKTWEYFPQAKAGVKVPVIAISTMPRRDDSSWDGLVQQVESVASTANSLIIDLRGNGGGDMEKGQMMARRLFGIQDDSVDLSPPSKLQMPYAPEAFAVNGNSDLLQILFAKLSGQPVADDLVDDYQGFLNEFKLSAAGKIPKPPPVVALPFSFVPAKVFKGPIRILVDANCASSCEWTVMFFERHPNAKLVGERTFGAFHFDNVGYAWLPNSHLLVGMPTISYAFDSGHSLYLERKGFAPDILVPPGSDALDYALKDIAKSGPLVAQ
jgi:hypothetical protein